jgi:regulator of replication initiation timing
MILLAEFESQTERARVEFDVKGGELRQVKERWQVREKDWFEARMNLEREVEMIKAELQGANDKAARWGEEKQQLLNRVENLRVRLGEEEEEDSEEVKEYDAYSASNLARRKLERQREGEEELSEDGGGDGEVRQLKMELEEVKQMLMKQEAMAAEVEILESQLV